MDKEIDKRTAEAMIEFVKTFASLNADNMRRVHDYIHALKRSQEAEDRGQPVKQVPRDVSKCRCSFCGKSDSQVNRMIIGPGVGICNECVHLCERI